MSWSSDDTLFKKELARGRFWEQELARQIRKFGHEVDLKPLEYRDHISEVETFTRDQSDLVIGGRWIVEVKSRNLGFDWCPNSIPARYMPFIVDDADKWDLKAHKPHAYVFISRVTGRYVCLQGSTRPRWTIQTIKDRGRGTVKRYYMCERGLLRPGGLLMSTLARRRV